MPRKSNNNVAKVNNIVENDPTNEVNNTSENNLIQELLKQIADLKRQIDQPKNEPARVDYSVRYIKVISLYPGMLILTNQKNSTQVKAFEFKNFGDSKKILYQDLMDIIDANRSFLEKGYFFIADPDIIEMNGLSEIYETILTKEQIEKIFKTDFKEALAVYKTANETQKRFIRDILSEKMLKDEEIDQNFVFEINKISKVDLYKQVEEAKALLTTNNDTSS